MQKPSVDDDDEDAGAEVVEIARLVSELQGAASVEGRAESRPRTSANGRALRASIAVEVATGRTGAGKAGGVEARLAGWAGVGVRGEQTRPASPPFKRSARAGGRRAQSRKRPCAKRVSCTRAAVVQLKPGGRAAEREQRAGEGGSPQPGRRAPSGEWPCCKRQGPSPLAGREREGRQGGWLAGGRQVKGSGRRPVSEGRRRASQTGGPGRGGRASDRAATCACRSSAKSVRTSQSARAEPPRLPLQLDDAPCGCDHDLDGHRSARADTITLR